MSFLKNSLAAVFMALALGAPLGFVLFHYSYSKEVETYKTQSAKIQKAFKDGVHILANCPYLRRAYPKRHRYLIKYVAKPIWFIKAETTFELCASAQADIRTISLYANFFTHKGCQTWKEMIAHEVLHLVGFPNHKIGKDNKVIDKRDDVVYLIIDHCFNTNFRRR